MRVVIVRSVAAFAVLQHVHGSFNIYRSYDPVALSESLGISLSCMETLSFIADKCEDWSQSNVTKLCTSTCSDSLTSWLKKVESVCPGNQVYLNGVTVEPRTLPLNMISGYDLACLKDSSDRYCLLESYSWIGSHPLRYDGMTCFNADATDNPPECSNPDFDTSWITPDMTAVTNLYPKTLANCSTSMPYITAEPTHVIAHPTNSIATATTSSRPPAMTCAGQSINATNPLKPCDILSNTYGVGTGALRLATDDYYCLFNSTICAPQPCITQHIWKGTCAGIAASLSNSTHKITETMFISWNEIQGSCDDMVPQVICIGPPGGEFKASGIIYAPTQTGGYFTIATPPVPTEPGALDSCGLYYQVAAGDTCQSISLRYGISFAQLRKYNTQLNSGCTNLWLGYAVCVAPVTPAPKSSDGTCGPDHGNTACDGATFGSCCSKEGKCGNGADYCSQGKCLSGACDDGRSVSTDGSCNATVSCIHSKFGDCCNTSGHCGSSKDFCGQGNCFSGKCDPGISGPSTNGECGPNFAGNKTCTGTQFGSCCNNAGYCGDSIEYCGTGNCYSGSCNDAKIPNPHQDGIASTCNKYAQSNSDGQCQYFAPNQNISYAQLYAWNSVLGNNGENCGKMFLGGEYYCTGVSGARPAPGPSQPGVVDTCVTYAKADSGTTCPLFASTHRISESNFYAWNSVLGKKGENCQTKLLADEYYCIMVADHASSPPSKTSSSALPGPTQSGIISTCNKYVKSNSDGQCQYFAPNNGISLAQLYAWNSVLGYHGEHCDQFLGNEAYCVGVAGPLPAPGPSQSGVIDTCIQYAKSNPGGSCDSFSQNNGLSLSQLYSWNSVLGQNGENCQTKFWANEYYCIAVAGPRSIPSPHQDGIISTCNKYAKTTDTDTCVIFSPGHGISTAQLYAWNSILGYHGENCNSQFLHNEYYCVGVSGPLPAPGPSQDGVTDTCIKYNHSNPGGTCSNFAKGNNMVLSNLYKWNPVLGANGENCQTEFLANEWYCVAVAG